MQNQREKNERGGGVFLDMAHLILGIAIVIFAVLSFINPEGNTALFPLVFLLAALLNAINGVFRLKNCVRNKKRFRMGIFQILVCAGLGLLGVLSAISLWN